MNFRSVLPSFQHTRQACVSLTLQSIVLSGLACAALPSDPAQARQSDRVSTPDNPGLLILDQMVVTATRSERPTADVPAAVIAVGKDRIADTTQFSLKEALYGLAGVQAETRNGGYDSRLVIRGAGLKANYGVREIMILLDGVPITDPDGMSRLDFVDTQLVEHIDVIKGPNSTLYGANASGGVINIITKSPFEEVRSLRLGFGDHRTQAYNAIASAQLGRTHATATASYKSTEGWRQWNRFDTSQFSFKIAHRLDEGAHFEVSLARTEANIQLPGTLTLAQFDRDISQLTSEPWKNSGRYSQIFNTSARFTQKRGSLKLDPLIYYQHWRHYHPVTGMINSSAADVYGAELQASWDHTMFQAAGTLIGGLSGQGNKVPDSRKYKYRDVTALPTGRITATLSDAAGELAETGSDIIDKWGIYVQETVRPSKAWIIDAGLRYDRVRFDLNHQVISKFDYATGRYGAAPQSILVGQTFDYVSPRIGAVYKLNRIYNLYGNLSTGFQTPQGSEISVNQSLQPATTFNHEVGLKARLPGGGSLDVSLFHQKVSSEVVQTYLTGGYSSYNNAGATQKDGLELAGSLPIARNTFVGASYSHSRFRFDQFLEPISGQLYDRTTNQLPYVPRDQYSVFATFHHRSGFRARIDTNTWGRYWVDNANTTTYDGYSYLTNLQFGYAAGRWDLSLNVANLFDQRYAMEVTSDSTGLRYRPGAPRGLFARSTFSF